MQARTGASAPNAGQVLDAAALQAHLLPCPVGAGTRLPLPPRAAVCRCSSECARAGGLQRASRRGHQRQTEWAAAELAQERQEQQVLLARRTSGGDSVLQGMPQAPFSLAGWQPSAPHVVMFRAINQILAGHEWSPAEQADLLRN